MLNREPNTITTYIGFVIFISNDNDNDVVFVSDAMLNFKRKNKLFYHPEIEDEK